jgi:predicted NUDIX family NTP pyrophosphohydrolase
VDDTVAMRRSAALVAYRHAVEGGVEVLIGHMGGPFWAKKDEGAWSVPKGAFEDGEEALDAARREFTEEIGLPPPEGRVVELGDYPQPSNKLITAFGVEGDVDLAGFSSNLFELQWPPRSGRMQQFPEFDRAAWTPVDVAVQKVVKGQVAILEHLVRVLAG